MKKIILSLLSVVLSLGIVIPLSKTNIYANENIYSVTIENNNYSSTIETIYYNDISSRYMVLENDTEYYMEILSTGDVVIDSRRYSSDSFNDMILRQSIDINDINKSSKSSLLDYINEYPYIDDPTDYESINKEIELEKNSISLYNCCGERGFPNFSKGCTPWGSFSPGSPPTNGYNGFIGDYVRIKTLDSFVVNMSSTAIGALASKLCKGVLSKAKNLMGFLVGWVASGYIDATCNGKYYRKQSLHPICPKATRERRKYYVITKSGKVKSTDIYDDYYFYHANPY